MIITGTSSIQGILTIEIRDAFERAHRSISIRSGQTRDVHDSFRFHAAIVDAEQRGFITVALEDEDKATQQDLDGFSSGGGFPAALYGAAAEPFTLSADMTCEGDDVTTLFEFPEFEIPALTRILFFTWTIVEFPVASVVENLYLQDTDGGVYINGTASPISNPDFVADEGQNITDDVYGLQIQILDNGNSPIALPDGETVRVRLVAWGYTMTPPSDA